VRAQCMDFRLRKHECKHIKLLKQTLGAAPEPRPHQHAQAASRASKACRKVAP